MRVARRDHRGGDYERHEWLRRWTGSDTIRFSVTGTIPLASTLPQVTGTLTIKGPVSTSITISGGGFPHGVQVMQVASGARLHLKNLTIANGRGNSSGGIENDGTLTVTNSTFSGNVGGAGGGIFNDGTLTVANSTFSGDGALGSGGGIFNRGMLTVANSTFSGNEALRSGAIENDGTLTVTNSTFSDSGSENVGGILNDDGGTLTITNSTFSGNRCMHSCGGGISNDGTGTLTVTSSTFSGNMGGPGGIDNSGSASLKNTILAASTDAPPPIGLRSENCIGSITDAGYNISDDSSCGFAKTGSANNGDGINPLLSTDGLANNGGPTETIALASGSPAIDAIPVADCTDQASPAKPITIDQRDLPRPDAGEDVCDIGAYESQETFAGQPGAANCDGVSVSALAQQFGSIDAAVSALGFPSVKALQKAIRAFCRG